MVDGQTADIEEDTTAIGEEAEVVTVRREEEVGDTGEEVTDAALILFCG